MDRRELAYLKNLSQAVSDKLVAFVAAGSKVDSAEHKAYKEVESKMTLQLFLHRRDLLTMADSYFESIPRDGENANDFSMRMKFG